MRLHSASPPPTPGPTNQRTSRRDGGSRTRRVPDGGLVIELGDLFGRKVDLITRWTLDHEQSPKFRANILAQTELLYAA